MDYKDINDYELLYLVKENDEVTINILYNKYNPFINSILKKWTAIAKKLGIDIDDLEQECYLAFVKAVKSYDEDNSTLFYTYLNYILDRHIKNLFTSETSYKKCSNLNSFSLNTNLGECDDGELIDVIPDNNSINPIDVFNLSQKEDLIKDFCFDLKISQASVFELYYNGYKVREISKLLGLSSNCVSVSLKRILEKLEKSMAKEDLLVI